MNSELKDVSFKLDNNIIDHLKNQKPIPGFTRTEDLIKKGEIGYGQLKKFIHEMKRINKITEPQKYNYYGGDMMFNWCMTKLKGARDQIANRKESRKIADDISGLTGERQNASIKRHTKNNFSPKIGTNDVVKPKSNSEKFTNSSMFSAKSTKLFEQINRIKKLMI